MVRHALARLTALGVVGGAALAGMWVATGRPMLASAEETPAVVVPPPPPWVRADGTIDVEKFPRLVAAVGPGGVPLTDATGAPLCVEMLVEPPVDPALKGVESGSTTEGAPDPGRVLSGSDPTGSSTDSDGVEVATAPPPALVPCS